MCADWLGVHFPVLLIRIRYFFRFHRPIHLKSPQNINEKILYLSLFTDTSQWTELADKYRVRSYVSNIISDKYLPFLYGCWENPEDINFQLLPNSFVLKLNSGSGTNIIVRDKASLDFSSVKDTLINWMRNPYGAREAGLHYLRIKPCIIAEQLLQDGFHESLIDYKIWCFNGIPYTISTFSNRTEKVAYLGCYDLDWTCHPERLVPRSHYPIDDVPLEKPSNLDEMLSVATRLAKPFPQVRVDLYNINGQVFFGELTFTSLGGLMNYFTKDFLLEMGRQVDLSYRG